MEYLETNESAEFSTSIKKLETTDPAHPDSFNPQFQQLLNNTIANRRDAKVYKDETNGYYYKLIWKDGKVYYEIVSGGSGDENITIITEEKVNELIATYIQENGISGSVTDEQIATAVNTYMTSNNTTQTNNKKWLLLGDSVTYGLGATVKYSDIIKERYGINTVDNKGVPGSYVFNYGDSSVTNTCLANIIKIPNKKQYTHCTICFGINDSAKVLENQDSDGIFTTIIGNKTDVASATPTTLISALKYIIGVLLTENPAMKILLLSDNAKYEATYSNSVRTAFEAIDDAFYDVAERYKVEFLSLFRLFPVNSYNWTYYIQSDTVHPSDEGQKKIAELIIGNKNEFFDSDFYNAASETEIIYILTETAFNGSTQTDTALKLFDKDINAYEFTIFLDFIVPSVASANYIYSCLMDGNGIFFGLRTSRSLYCNINGWSLVGNLGNTDNVIFDVGTRVKIALTCISNKYVLYINGVKHSEVSSQVVTKKTQTLHVGALVDNATISGYFNGTINSLKVYNTCLNATEVALL